MTEIEAYVDTDVLVRFFTGDDPAKQRAALSLFARVERGETAVASPDTVIADLVYVLVSPRLYARPRDEVRDALARLISLPGFEVWNKGTVLKALDLFAATELDFGDAMIAAACMERGPALTYSYDRDFDTVPGVHRMEP